jgi:hypothetical protein
VTRRGEVGGRVRTVSVCVMVVVAESGARLWSLLFASLLALRSATLAARSRGTARSKRPRRAGAAEVTEAEVAVAASALSVDRAAAVTKVGVMVQVGSGHLWDGGMKQAAVLVLVVGTGMTV